MSNWFDGLDWIDEQTRARWAEEGERFNRYWEKFCAEHGIRRDPEGKPDDQAKEDSGAAETDLLKDPAVLRYREELNRAIDAGDDWFVNHCIRTWETWQMRRHLHAERFLWRPAQERESSAREREAGKEPDRTCSYWRTGLREKSRNEGDGQSNGQTDAHRSEEEGQQQDRDEPEPLNPWCTNWQRRKREMRERQKAVRKLAADVLTAQRKQERKKAEQAKAAREETERRRRDREEAERRAEDKRRARLREEMERRAAEQSDPYRQALARLGLQDGVTPEDLARGFRDAMMVAHSDKGGTDALAQKVLAARVTIRKRNGWT